MGNRFEDFLKGSEFEEHTAFVRFSQFYLRPLRAWLWGEYKHFARLKEVMGPIFGERILEVGVGSYVDGFTKYSSYAGTFVGIDVDKKTVDKLSRWAKKNCRVERFFVGDGTRLPFKDGSFDRVLFNNFTGNFEASIREARRVLRKGGKVYVAFVTHPFYFRPKELLPDIPSFWDSRGFKCIVPLGWTEDTRNANCYYLTIAERR